MKKMYTKIKSLTAAFCLLSFGAWAQLSNVSPYTINKTQPVSATNFTSFTDVAAVLNNLGVTGPVTINVVANTGPYNEQVQFTQAAAVSAINSVVINGNGNTIAFNATNSAQPWTWSMGGADYMTVNNLNIYGTNSTY